MKKICFLLFSLLLVINGFAQNYTEEFAVKDTNRLLLDIYTPSITSPDTNFPCLVFVFGGGFKTGQRNAPIMIKTFTEMAKRGYVIVSIDYRLGLKGVTKMGVTHLKTLENAIRLAVEDLYSATSYIYKNAARLHINTNEIMISGVSAGAITVLQADYWLHNRHETAQVLPDNFRYAGVISFSGAIFSRNGKVKYPYGNPAPTLFYHGDEDHLVTYNQVAFANLGFFGSNKLVQRFEKFNYPYRIKRMKNYGHEVATLFPDMIDEIDEFYQNWIVLSKKYQIDETWYNPEYQPDMRWRLSPSDLYKKNK